MSPRAVAALKGGMIVVALVLAGCDKDMSSQDKDKTWHAAQTLPNGLKWPLSPPDGMVTRDPPPLPPKLSLTLIERGRQRYDIDCAPCHGATGAGDGIIVERGFPAPPPLTDKRIVAAPTQHYVDVISNGDGIMYSFAERVAPPDRWAIAAYIRALQRAGSADLAAVPAARRSALP